MLLKTQLIVKLTESPDIWTTHTEDPTTDEYIANMTESYYDDNDTSTDFFDDKLWPEPVEPSRE